MRWLVPATISLVALVAGCGGDDRSAGAATVTKEDNSAKPPSATIAQAVAKTEAARTARVDFDFDFGGSAPRVPAEGLVDFANRRDLLTLRVPGQTRQLFNDHGRKYLRMGTRGRYRRQPTSSQAPVANTPSDSLKHLATDMVDLTEAAEDGCYDGSLDFTRVLKRARAPLTPGQSRLRGKKAQVFICVDDGGRIDRYDVQYAIGGPAVKLSAKLSDHGDAPSLGPLRPGERP